MMKKDLIKDNQNISYKAMVIFLILVLTFSSFKYIYRDVLVPLIKKPRLDSDFAVFYRAAENIREGVNIYGHQGYKDLRYFYAFPPFFAILLIPMTKLELPLAGILWLLINQFFVIGFIWIFLRLIKCKSWIVGSLFIFLILNYQPLAVEMRIANVNMLVFFLTGVSFYCIKKNKDILGGALLAFGAMIKLFPGFLVLYFLWKKHYKVVGSFSLVLTGILAFTIIIVGLEPHLVFVKEFIPYLLLKKGGIETSYDQSISNFFTRFSFIFRPAAPFTKSHPLIKVFTLFSSLFIFIMMIFGCWGKVKKESFHFDLQFSLVIISFLLMSSLMWEPYLIFLLLPFFIVLNYLLNQEKLKILLIVMIAMSYMIIALRYGYDDPILRKGIFILLTSAKLYGTVLLWLVVIYILKSDRKDKVYLKKGPEENI